MGINSMRYCTHVSILILICSVFYFSLLSPNSSHADAGFNEILQQIDKSSPQLKQGEFQALAAKEAIRVARSQYWGKVLLFGQDSHFDSARLINPISFSANLTSSLFDKDQYSYGVMATLPLDINGRITARTHAKKELSYASTQVVSATRLLLFKQASILYRSLQGNKGLQEAASKQLNALKKHYDTTATALRVGRVPRVELLRIDAELKAVEGKLAGLSGEELSLRASLAALMNEASFNAQIRPENVPPRDPRNSFPVKIIERRPDIKAALHNTRAEQQNVKEAKRQWLPDFAVQAVSASNGGYNGESDETWSLTSRLSWEVWDGGRRSANSALRRSQYRASESQLQFLKNKAKAEFDSALSVWDASEKQFKSSQSGLVAATETERIQSDRFKNGRISAVDFVDAEAALAGARGSHASALANWWLADDRLHIAAGMPPIAYDRNTKGE